MSILQEYEQIKKEMGIEKWDSIEKYIKIQKPYLRLDHIIYNKERFEEYNNWFYENIKGYKINNFYAWNTDYGDIKCSVDIYENGSMLFNVICSYEGTVVDKNYKENISTIDYENKKIQNSLKSLIYNDIEKYKSLPKRSECSKLLQEVFDSVRESDASMCHIDYEEWNDYYSENYTEEDIEKLKSEVAKFELNSVLEVCADNEYKIVGYGDLETRFVDDRRTGEKYVYLDDEIKVLKNCKDYYMLLNSLENWVLKSFDKSLSRYLKSDLDPDEYKRIYGDENLVNWCEGLMETKDFINEYIDKNLYYYKDIMNCIKNIESAGEELKSKNLSVKEEYEYILKKYDGFIDMIDEDDKSYTIDVFEGLEKNSILATLQINKQNGNIKVADSFDIFNCQNDKFLNNYSKEDIEKVLGSKDYEK